MAKKAAKSFGFNAKAKGGSKKAGGKKRPPGRFKDGRSWS